MSLTAIIEKQAHRAFRGVKMGNRAVVRFGDDKHGVYLHWNGGRDSVLAFVETLSLRGWTRIDYASARFVAVVGEFFDADGNDQGLSLGILDHTQGWVEGCDNGEYHVTASPGGRGLKVSHNGTPISHLDLEAGQLKRYQEMIQLLGDIRCLRVKMAKEAS